MFTRAARATLISKPTRTPPRVQHIVRHMLVLCDSIDLTAAVWAEKFDGVSARWDGKSLWSRSGRKFDVPDEFLSVLPSRPAIGELWAGRGCFEIVLSVIQQGQAGDWSQLDFVEFDSLDWQPVDDLPRDIMRRIVDVGGEGIVIRSGSGDEYKCKPVTDSDATVIAHIPGKAGSRLAAVCGALLVRDDVGREFRLGSGLSDADRQSPPAIGAIVSFSFQGRTRHGKPRFPVFTRERAEDCLCG